MNLTSTLLENRLNLFYILVFAPLVPIQYFGYIARHDYFAALIPLYGALILLFKQDKMATFSEPNRAIRLLGLALMIASFFVYYPVAFFHPAAQFYGVANYTIFLIGLFLSFFQVSALRAVFTTLFLIAAAISSPIVGRWMHSFLEPLIPFFVRAMGYILIAFGLPVRVVASNALSIQMPGGWPLTLGVEAGCIGIDSFLTFAIIVVVIMMEDSSSLRTKVLWSIAGVIGTFAVNIIRVSLIFAVIYHFGYENWGVIHSRIGYILFITWLALFFLIFWKRQAILSKLQILWRRIR